MLAWSVQYPPTTPVSCVMVLCHQTMTTEGVAATNCGINTNNIILGLCISKMTILIFMSAITLIMMNHY